MDERDQKQKTMKKKQLKIFKVLKGAFLESCDILVRQKGSASQLVIDQIPDLAEAETNTETESLRHTDTEIEYETERSKVEKITSLFSDSKKVYQRLTFQKQRGNKLQLFN